MGVRQRSRSKLGMDVLMWVSHGERPLHVDESCYPLDVEGGSVDLTIRNIPAIETLLACSLGLVTVEKCSSTIRLIHYTLQEYLPHNSDLFLNTHCGGLFDIPQFFGISGAFRQPVILSHQLPVLLNMLLVLGHARQETTESAKTLV